MNFLPKLRKPIAVSMMAWMTLQPLAVVAEDIDLFVGSSAGTAANPNVLIVLDNTSNWARQSQKWPGGEQQGQSEVDAIKTVVNSIDYSRSPMNIGLMEFVTGSGANNNGGFIRSAIKPMSDAANLTALSTNLTTIYNNINAPIEKRNSGTAYGNLVYDIYNYFAGANQSQNGAATEAGIADASGYDNTYSKFKSPLSCGTSCAKTFVIFITNPDSSGPTHDDAPGTPGNTSTLSGLGGNTLQLALPGFTTSISPSSSLLYRTNTCYANQSACATSEATKTAYTSVCPPTTVGNYDSCSCAAANDATNPAVSSLPACTSGNRYQITAISNTVTTGPTPGTPVTTTASSTSCYPSAAAATSAATAGTDRGTLTCPTTSTSTSGSTTTTTTHPCTYSAGATTGSACASSSTTSTSTTSACYKSISSGAPKWSTSGDNAGLTCPAGYSCTYSGVLATNVGCADSSYKHVTVTQTATPTSTTYHYTLTQTDIPSVSTSTPGTGTVTVGNTLNCYADASSCTTAGGVAEYATSCATYGNCTCSAVAPSVTCPSGASYGVVGNTNIIVNTPSGGSTIDTAPYNADEWSRFMYQFGIPLGSGCSNQKVTTYTVDVYNAQPNATHTSLMMSMAKVGGGKYFNATNKQAIVDALKKIFQEIQSVNSTFAAASLPVNATNRSQNQNQVYIGMFRPDSSAKPRWFGNLKRYKFAFAPDGVTVELVDKNGTNAVNNNTGFVDDCATSYWTTDSKIASAPDQYYWSQYPIEPTPASSCSTVSGTAKAFSDAPDGPDVGKGAVAEVLRSGNLNSTTPDWLPHRTIYTVDAAGTLSAGGPTSGLNTDQQAWLTGADNYVGESALFLAPESTVTTPNVTTIPTPPTASRASMHGDVVHSRPLPVTYSTTSLVVYYGANDGYFRAVDSETGKELWSVVPSEFATPTFVERLRQNDPLVSYPSVTTAGALPKPYGWDGSTGLYQSAAGSGQKVWVYPTQRRGGRYVYGFDVSTATSPSLLFRIGCDPAGVCSTFGGSDFSQIGQTWSMPNVAPVQGYAQPVAFFGGGYDTCEDANTSTPSCATTKGNRVFAVDASNGTKLAELATTRAVPGDVALVDVNNDGYADYGYVGDTGGNLYRISMATRSVTGTVVSYAARVPSAWTICKIGHTSGGGRKFLFAPALFPVSRDGKMYVAIGSGDREHPLESNYPYSTPVTNRFYVFVDNLAAATCTDNNLDALADQTTDPGCGTTTTPTTAPPNGWFMDLPGRGEQTVTSAIIAGGLIAFSTNRPLPAVTGTCATPLGEARGYWVNLTTGAGAIGVDGLCGGTRNSTFVGGGLPPSPVIGTVPIDGRPVTVIIGAVQKEGGASTPISPQKVKPSVNPVRKRVYWKQLGVD